MGFTPVLILVQWNRNKSSKTFYEYSSLEEALQGICSWYENHLRQVQPHLARIRYEANDLLHFLQHLPQLECLLYDSREGKYIPYGQEWIKQRMLGFLTRRANRV
ncbi:Enhancer of rudimentary [Galdieria sulphuraria]|nr:Enhancer of rudimentary [Galdieria sulphuraria]